MTDECQKRLRRSEKLICYYSADTDAALKALQDVKISMHCWQGDDVKGFLTPEGELSVALLATVSPGAPYTEQLRQDLGCLLIFGNTIKLVSAIYLTRRNVDLNEIVQNITNG